MKKLFKTVLSVILAFGIILVPMTVMAETSGEEPVNYLISDILLETGTKEYDINNGYEYTLFEFTPDQSGIYTITSANNIGNLGGGWFYFHTPDTDTVNLNTVVFECREVGPSAIIAVENTTETTTITITREELPVIIEVPWTTYENVFSTKGCIINDVDSLDYVDIYDDLVDKAVLGSDGYYHLNVENGPILFVDLDDAEYVNLADAAGLGQLMNIIKDGDEIVTKINYSTAFLEYVDAANDDGIYPLTFDLIEIYKNVGAYQDWYGAEKWVDSDCEDAWMFTCMYGDAKVTTFTDVNAGEWYNDAINFVSNSGIITGYGGTTNFGTADKITRHDFVVILSRLAGVDLSVYDNAEITFTDVADDQYYTNAILWAAEAGITTGYSDGSGKFGVGDNITREQLVTFLYRYSKFANGGRDPIVSEGAADNAAEYADYVAVTDYAQDAVIWALDSGVIKGQDGTYIDPTGNTLRCEVAQIIYNLCN